jgi:hypothetical protein
VTDDGKNPNRAMRLPRPTAAQRRVVGELILLGNRRRQLFEEAFQTEAALRAKVIEAFGQHQVPKRIIAPAASVARHTVYQWLIAAGLHEKGVDAALYQKPSEISLPKPDPDPGGPDDGDMHRDP